MKCDSCGDEIGNLGDDWVALSKSEDICTVCAAEEIESLRAEVERLREENKALQVSVDRKTRIIANFIDLVDSKTEAGGAG